MSKDMIEELRSQGISLKNYNVGAHKTTCPRCSHVRKDKKDPCLWVNVKEANLALWKCHNCEWTGSAGDVGNGRHEPMDAPAKRQYTKPAAPGKVTGRAGLPSHVMEYLTVTRGIPEEVINRNRIYWDEKRESICFPYFQGGELINVKYRTLDKRFQMERGAKLVLYGLDDVPIGTEEVIIVEGEFDKLALEACGIKNVLSVPNGAPGKIREDDKDAPPENTGAFEYLMHSEELLKAAKRVVLAVDDDKAGDNLRYELARRIGAAKCHVAKFTPHKDANDSLLRMGVDITLDCLKEAVPYPISGLYTVNDFQDSLEQYYTGGMTAGVSTGWPKLDKLYTVMPGELTVVTGIPNSGKSEFVDALCINLAQYNDWKFAIFSPENGKEQHVAKLVEKIIGAPTSPKSANRMALDVFMGGASWISNKFYFIVAEDSDALPTLDWVLEKATAAVYRYGVRGFVLDPWNEVEHTRPGNMNETEYVGHALAKIKRWGRMHGVAVWIVAHPTKQQADKDGKMRPPSLYEISGSANWANKVDNGIVIFRSEDVADTTEVHVKKVRFKHVGRRGISELRYDKETGRYSQPFEDEDIPRGAYADDPGEMTSFEV